MEHVPLWIQGVVAVALFLGAMIGAIVVVSRRGAKYLAGEGGDAQFVVDLRELRNDVDAKLNEIYDKVHQLTIDFAVMRERQTNNLQILQDLQREFLAFERRRQPPPPEER